jgi:hypothetical protein
MIDSESIEGFERSAVLTITIQGFLRNRKIASNEELLIVFGNSEWLFL